MSHYGRPILLEYSSEEKKIVWLCRHLFYYSSFWNFPVQLVAVYFITVCKGLKTSNGIRVFRHLRHGWKFLFNVNTAVFCAFDYLAEKVNHRRICRSLVVHRDLSSAQNNTPFKTQNYLIYFRFYLINI